MLQKRLNDIRITHIFQDVLDNLDMNEFLNNFISKANVRAKTFTIIKKK